MTRPPRLCATESSGLNDPSEVVRACDDLLATWEATEDDLIPEAPEDEAAEWLRRMTAETKLRRFFFVSGCTEGDKLQHWTSYAGGGGYALEFERNSEFRLLQPRSAPVLYMPEFAPYPWWRPVTYGDYRNGRSANGRSLYTGRDGIMSAVLDGLAARARGEVADDTAFWEELERLYVTSVCSNKHEGYSSEDEVRLVFVEPPSSEYLHHRDGRFSTGPTAYLKVAADCTDPYTYSIDAAPPLPLKQVRIGPRHGSDVTKEVHDVKDVLQDCGYVDVPVVVSGIPYRG